MTTYRLIDTDTRETVATGESPAEVLAETPYLPSDCLDGAETWQQVWDASRDHADGIMGLVEGYTVERRRMYGLRELSDALGVSRTTASTWVRRGTHGIPDPDESLASGPVWLASTIEAWIVERRG